MIREYYPRAAQHLLNAQLAKVESASLWSTLLEGGLVDQEVVTYPDGSGVISAWPTGRQAELTDLFRGP
ncbi:hypothetical protein [Streptomyces sp. NPDC101237]|uniref:hypothetical protein n=1 Tax=Streptomyces sp. NPDC101237 TaxID=3366139 RepID=UPI00381F4890